MVEKVLDHLLFHLVLLAVFYHFGCNGLDICDDGKNNKISTGYCMEDILESFLEAAKSNHTPTALFCWFLVKESNTMMN